MSLKKLLCACVVSVLLFSAVSLVVSSGKTMAASTSATKVTWRLASLLSNSKIKTSLLVVVNSPGARSWTVKGNCSLKSGVLAVKSSGTCTVGLKIKKFGKYSAVSVQKKISIFLPNKSNTPSTSTPVANISSSTTSVPSSSTTSVPSSSATSVPSNSEWWTAVAESSGFNFITELTTIGDGSTVVTGYIRASTKFGVTTVGTRGIDLFVAKVSSSGQWLWVASAGGPYDDYAYTVSGLSDGSFLVGGYFEGSASFGSISLSNSRSTRDAFVAKVSSSGQWMWASQITGSGVSSATSIESLSVMADGSAIVTGDLYGSATAGTYDLSGSVYTGSIFVAKISDLGTWMWAKNVVGGSRAQEVSVSSDGSAIVVGEFYGSVTLGAIQMSAIQLKDVFVAKISSTGNWVWAVSAGGNGEEIATQVSVLSDGSAIVTGQFGLVASFGSIAITASSSNGPDVFVAKISASGQWVWALSAGGRNYDWANGLVIARDGSAVVTGTFQYIATFGAFTVETANSTDTDIFIAKASPEGVWMSAKKIGVLGEDYASDVGIISDETIVLAGKTSRDGKQMVLKKVSFGPLTP